MSSGLPWFRMDTDIYANGKIVDLVDEHGQKGKAAAAVYLFALAYSNAHLTDGVIRKSVLKFVHGTPADARLLVEAGMFEAVETGWAISNYSEHQPSRETVEALSAQRSQRAREAAQARWGGQQ